MLIRLFRYLHKFILALVPTAVDPVQWIIHVSIPICGITT